MPPLLQFSEIALEGARSVMPFLVLRAAPFCLAALGSKAPNVGAKVAACVGYAGVFSLALLCGFSPVSLLEIIAPTYLFLSFASLLVWGGARVNQRYPMPAWLLLAASAGLGLFLPRALLPAAAVSTATLVGWEFMLSAYSYVVEIKRGAKERSLPKALFFLMVNPTLVYTSCGRVTGRPNLGLRALSRVLLGLLVLTGFFMVRGGALGVHVAPAWLVLGFVISEYAGHSGRASVEIGFMRMLGWEIPERYRYPFLARSPADFWRRWNTYVCAWARRYAFLPIAFGLGGKRLKLPRFVAVSGGVLGAFLLIGFLHDLANVQRGLATVGGFTLVFFANGVVLLVWEAARRGLLRVSVPAWVKAPARRVPAAQAANWLACMVFLIGMGFIAIPLFSGNTDVLTNLYQWISS